MSKSCPKIVKCPLRSSTFDKDIGRQEYPLQKLSQDISLRCSNSSSVFLIMWRLFNNSNQVPIILSIFGVVLTFVQYFFAFLKTHSARSFSFRCGRRHWRWIIKWVKNWKSPFNIIFSFLYIRYIRRYFSIIDESRECRGCEPLGGLEACYPRKFWHFDAMKRYSCVLRGWFLCKMFAKLSVIFMPIFICVFSHTSTRFCFIFQVVYLRFQVISFN